MNGSDAGARLLARVQSREARCGVLGLGYVGLPLALAFARAGYTVVGYDVSADVVAALNRGESHIADVAGERLAEAVHGGRLRATAEETELRDCDVLAVCVPTPLSKTRDPDVSYILAATDALARTLRPGQLVIMESTTYPGTTRELMLPRLEAGGLRAGRDFFLCFSPERVDPGNERWQVGNTPKVIGGITAQCLHAGVTLYENVLETVVPVSSTEAAELTKLLENTFRAVNIALVNEMAQVCALLGVDVFEVVEAAATKPFGFMKFTPGPGIGGHCIPLDPHYLAWKMRTLNYKTRMIELAGEVNSEMPRFVADKVRDVLNERGRALKGAAVLLIGVAYKRDIDDVRESPALDILRLLEEKGARVDYHDPHVPELREDGRTRRSVALTPEVLERVDCILVVTDHSAVDYRLLAGRDTPVIDTRDVLRELPAENVVGLTANVRATGRGRAGQGESRPPGQAS